MSNETTVRRMARIWAGNGKHNAIHTGLKASLTIAMAVGLSAAAQTPVASHTSLTAETREVSGHTVATFTSTVLTAEGTPATGVVTLVEKGKSVAGAALDSEGKATITVDGLTPGDHALTAVYGGSATSSASTSESVTLHPQATASPDFSVAIAPASLSVKQGAAGTVVVSVAPAGGFTGFISLSCSGTGQTTTLPVGVTCSFSPANLQVTATSAATANLSVQTSTAGGTHAANQVPGSLTGSKAPVALAVLFPGAIGLCFLARKRKNLRVVALLILVGGVSLLGTTACSARYRYLNHGPGFGGTALGAYTLTITAQTSNGVTATAHSTSLALTVD